MSTYFDTDETVREECPWCRSRNINGLGWEFDLEDIQPIIYVMGECYDCGVTWKEKFSHDGFNFDETNMSDYD